MTLFPSNKRRILKRTSINSGHWHPVNEKGSKTTSSKYLGSHPKDPHTHEIVNGIVQRAGRDGHTHVLEKHSIPEGMKTSEIQRPGEKNIVKS